MLLFGIVNIAGYASYSGINFLGSALTFMMTYIWGRRNEDVKMSFLGFCKSVDRGVLICGCCCVVTFCNTRLANAALFSFHSIVTFNAPYIPWVMLTFSVLLGNSVTTDLIGIAVGHMYYFLEYVYPVVAEVRGWPIKRILEPPAWLHWLCGSYQQEQVRHEHVE